MIKPSAPENTRPLAEGQQVVFCVAHLVMYEFQSLNSTCNYYLTKITNQIESMIGH